MMCEGCENGFGVKNISMVPLFSVKASQLSSFPSQFIHLIQIVNLSQNAVQVQHHLIINLFTSIHSSQLLADLNQKADVEFVTISRWVPKEA